MADWSVPGLTTAYATVLTNLKDRDVDAYSLAESPSNPPTGAIRYVRASDKFQEWDGAAWNDKVLSIAGGGTGANSASGARTNLGLGSMALQNNNAVNITGGTITGLTTLGNPGAATGTWPFNGAAPQITLVNGISNYISWNANGVNPPTTTTSSAGTKLLLFPSVSGSITDYAIGIETNAMWLGVPNTSAGVFKFYNALSEALRIHWDASGTIPTLSLSPAVDSLGARLQISVSGASNANTFVQAGEPGVSANTTIISNNYRATTTGASARVNTSLGGSFIRLNSDGSLEFVRISNSGILARSAFLDTSGNLDFTLPDGSSGTPALRFGSQTGLGFYRNGGSKIALVSNALGNADFLFDTNTGQFWAGNPTGLNHSGSGCMVRLGHNFAGSGAAACIQLNDRTGNQYFLWVDSAGKLRINTASPTTGSVGSDTSGTIVGTQT